ncbi:MAG: metallophosphoesterase [Candidatus Hodarchaeota archaeon]
MIDYQFINGRFRVEVQSSSFKILHVTDMHLSGFNPLDWFCIKRVEKLAKMHDVDLIVITGDLFGHRKAGSMKRTVNLVENVLGKNFCWTLAWGNHDQEMHDRKHDIITQLDEVEAHLESRKKCIYKKTREFIETYSPDPFTSNDLERKAYQPYLDGGESLKHFDGFYGGNFHVEICSKEKKKPSWSIFILNSRRGYHVPPNALKWMEDRIKSQERALPTLCFYHVPNYEYRLIWEQGIAKGIKREKVCHEKDKGRIHEHFKKLGCIKACFVGHDHVNDYHGMMDGIDYVYGRKTCLGGYGSNKKVEKKKKTIKIGAKLIMLSLDWQEPDNAIVEHFSVFDDGTNFTYS